MILKKNGRPFPACRSLVEMARRRQARAMTPAGPQPRYAVGMATKRTPSVERTRIRMLFRALERASLHRARHVRRALHRLAADLQDHVALAQSGARGGAAGFDLGDLDALGRRAPAEGPAAGRRRPAGPECAAAAARVGRALGKRFELHGHRLLAAVAEEADLRLAPGPERRDLAARVRAGSPRGCRRPRR